MMQEQIASGAEFLRQQGWLNPATGGPDVPKIVAQLDPNSIQLPLAVEMGTRRSIMCSAAHEYRGELAAALAWYELGQYGWRGSRTPPGVDDEIPNLGMREGLGLVQLPAAICAERAGSTRRAMDLYGWAAGNFMLTPEEVQWFSDSGQVQAIWEMLGMRAYALLCAQDWEQALATAEETERWLQKDKGGFHNRVQIHLLPAVLALSRNKVRPAPENRQAAQAMLDPRAIRTSDTYARLMDYFYLFILRSRFGGELLAEG